MVMVIFSWLAWLPASESAGKRGWCLKKSSTEAVRTAELDFRVIRTLESSPLALTTKETSTGLGLEISSWDSVGAFQFE